MFSALKKLAKGSDDRCAAPMPMSSSLQKKFSRGVHFNMKILIKGDRNVGKSCLLQRLQGGPFIEDYVPTDQIQVAPIHWAYKNTDYIVKVEVWEVVDKGKTKKKAPLGLKLENQAAPAAQDEGFDTPVLDATFLDVYKNANGVILMFDITKPWTFDYVVKEMSRVPADLPVVVLGNHCDMQHHRQVHPHHIDQALHHAKLVRTAPVRYAESSMRNGFGLRLLHKFLSVPFLRLQKTSLLEQLQRNQKDMEEIEKELDDFQNSEESHYNLFLDRLANKRRQNSGQTELRPNNDRSPSIVLGAGKPIIPPNINPLLAQSLHPKLPKVQTAVAETPQQTQYVSPELTKMKPRHTVSSEMTPTQDSSSKTSAPGANTTSSSGALEEFYAGTLDSSFLEDLTPLSTPAREEFGYETESEDGDETNPKVTVDEDDLDLDIVPETHLAVKSTTEHTTQMRPKEDIERFIKHDIVPETNLELKSTPEQSTTQIRHTDDDLERFMNQATISTDSIHDSSTDLSKISVLDSRHHIQLLDNDFPIWAGDSSARRSPEGGEDPDVSKEPDLKEKKHKKKKSKDKDKGDYSDRSDRKDKKHKQKKSKNEKRPNPQQDLLAPSVPVGYDYEDYDSI